MWLIRHDCLVTVARLTVLENIVLFFILYQVTNGHYFAFWYVKYVRLEINPIFDQYGAVFRINIPQYVFFFTFWFFNGTRNFWKYCCFIAFWCNLYRIQNFLYRCRRNSMFASDIIQMLHLTLYKCMCKCSIPWKVLTRTQAR